MKLCFRQLAIAVASAALGVFAGVPAAIGSPPIVTAEVARVPFVWDEPQSQALYLSVDPRSCEKDEVAVLSLSGSGLPSRKFSSGPACDFGVAKSAGDYLAPWPKWRTEMDYGAWRFLDTKAICEEYDAESDEDVERCAQIGVYYVGRQSLSTGIDWSMSVGATPVFSGSARFVRSLYRKSRPARKLVWYQGPAPKGWWACAKKPGRLGWKIVNTVPGFEYGRARTCQPPRVPAKYKTRVTTVD